MSALGTPGKPAAKTKAGFKEAVWIGKCTRDEQGEPKFYLMLCPPSKIADEPDHNKFWNPKKPFALEVTISKTKETLFLNSSFSGASTKVTLCCLT